LSHKVQFFFQNLPLGYMTKTLNQILFFLHQIQNIFFSNIGNQNISLDKNRNPPTLQVKWSFPKLYRKEEQLTLHEHSSSFGGVLVAHLLMVFFCGVLLYVFTF
jgi:hypothetical protein